MPKERILVVEDESLVAMDMEQQLQDMGYEVVGLASSGREAIQKAISQKPDLVLMDIMLDGDMDGIQAAHEVRRRIDIPIIYLTAYADDTILKRAQLTEPGGYLVKPFMEESLHTTIQVALSRFPQEKSLKRRIKWFSEGLDCLDNAILMTDAQGRLTFMNKAARDLTGLKNEVISGKNVATIFQVFSTDSHTPLENPALAVLEKRAPIEVPDAILFEAETGKGHLISIDAKPVTDKQGELTGMVLAFKQAENQSSQFDLIDFIQDKQSNTKDIGTQGTSIEKKSPLKKGNSISHVDPAKTYLDKIQLLEEQFTTSFWECEAYLTVFKDALAKGDKRAFEYITKSLLDTLVEMRNICQIVEKIKEFEPDIAFPCADRLKKELKQKFLSVFKALRAFIQVKRSAADQTKWRYHWSSTRNRLHILKSSEVPLFDIIQVFLKDAPKLMDNLKEAIQLNNIPRLEEGAFALADAIETMEAHPLNGLTILASAAAMIQLKTEANYLLKQLEKAFLELRDMLQLMQSG